MRLVDEPANRLGGGCNAAFGDPSGRFELVRQPQSHAFGVAPIQTVRVHPRDEQAHGVRADVDDCCGPHGEDDVLGVGGQTKREAVSC